LGDALAAVYKEPMGRGLRWIAVLTAMGVLSGAACKRADPASIHRDKGDELFDNGQWIAAAEEYRLSLEADPNQDKLWEKKAVAHIKAGKLDDAALTLVKTVDRAPTPTEKSEVYRKVASIYLNADKLDMAEKYFSEAVKVDPKDEASLAWLGEISSRRGGARGTQAVAVPEHLQKAITYYDQAIAMNPASPNAYVNKRIALTKMAEYERQQALAAQRDGEVAGKDKAKSAEAKARVEQHQARMQQLKQQIDDLSGKITALSKPAKPK
jgi:tetratricopeptide (TPR) repeat protein